jgi:hypothetical protein
LVIAARHLYRIAGIADIDKLNPFDHPTGVNIKTGYDSFR